MSQIEWAVGKRESSNEMITSHRCTRFLAFALLLLAATTAGAEPPKVGDPAPPLVGKTLDGESVNLDDYRGKAIVVSYWATWCPYCLKELPVLVKIQNTVGKNHMRVIAVNTESRETFRKVANALQSLDLLLAYDPDMKGRAAYGVGPIPHMVVIKRDGTIDSIFKGYGEERLDQIVAAINRATGAGQPPPQTDQPKR